MMSGRPDFIIVCNHGIRSGHLDEVVRYTWPDRNPYIAHWGIPVAGPSGEVRQTQLAGNRRGITSLTADPDPLRMHHEIICVTQGCMCRAYRADVARLQTLFDALADDQTLRGVFTVSATDSEITITLAALHSARDTAKHRYRLRV
jgi:hypothetical protein